MQKGNIWVVDDDSSIRWVLERAITREGPVSYTHLTLPTNVSMCRSRWSPYH